MDQSSAGLIFPDGFVMRTGTGGGEQWSGRSRATALTSLEETRGKMSSHRKRSGECT